MYHHRHSQQQGSQPFSNGPRPPHHQPPPSQHQNRPASGMMDFRFPRPTQLPDELESALAIRGARDMDHRLVDHMSRPNQHQNQSSGSGIGQHASYGSNPVTLNSDNQPGHQQGVDWSSFQPPTKLFASPSSSASHQPQQQSQSGHTGTRVPNWTNPASDSPSPQARHPHGGGVDGQGLYTAESAGSILASFGLSNEDLEVLSHYPDDQLTPDTLPFILRDIQINKTGNQKPVASSPSTSASSFSRTIRDIPPLPSRSSPLARSRSPEVPSLLTVTQTAGKVIDYGHASRTKDESNTRETFKREQLSGERTVKIYPSSSSTPPKAEKTERRQVRLEHTESSKHGDRDYRRTSSDHHKSNRSPGREFPLSSKSCNLDRDYRQDGPKPRPSPDARSETSSRRSLSSSSGSKPHSSSKKLPTPTMISDFSAAVPKVYPHTCSLCDIQCDQEKDWVDHINTVNHTAACRDLRNKYPDWKPNLPSRSGRYGSRALWDPKDPSLSHSVSRSHSGSPSPTPPQSRHRVGPQPHRPRGRPYSPHHHLRYQRYTGGSSRSGMKRRHEESSKFSSETSRHPSFSRAGHSSKHGLSRSYTKTVRTMMKPGTKTNKTASAKATETSAKPPPAKKKKKVSTTASQHSLFADRLVYLMGIPKDASEQEVTDLVGSFGKINNVILMPCSEEESQKGEGQKASVCMVRVEDAQALSNATNLAIRDQQIAASVAKKPEAEKSSDANSKSAPGQDKGTVGEDAEGEPDPKTSDEKGIVFISGLPESGWSESDIIKLFQPFGVMSDIILATEIGKVLVFVSDMEIAQEIVKVNAFIPMKIGDCELKMSHLKQCVSLATPVALYNFLMGSGEPLETSVPVSWSSLLVIRNVPNTPSGPTEVQKLVRRFGTVIKTLVLNSMVICEMPTAAMALSVYKRFQAFPCIIQNNPLYFSRKPDPKTTTLTKVSTAYLDSSEDGKGSKTAAAADKEEVALQEGSESPGEGMEKDVDGKDEEVKATEKTVPEHEAPEENRSIDEEDKKQVLTDVVSDCLGAVDAQPEADLVETDMRETSAAANVTETTEEEKDSGSKEEGEETSSHATSVEKDVPELPKVTQAMVNALLVECRTRTTSKSDNTGASSNGEQAETPPETEQGEKPAEETTEPAENHTEEEELKSQERERKEREARKEKEAKERRERERRAWEKERAKREREREERARRERERREEERREWERRERARRERKRAYDEGSRSSYRLEGYKQSSWRDGRNDSSDAKRVEEEPDEFPFNLSDFVTVDEVGDVTDLPRSPSPTVPIETAEESAPPSAQKDAETDTSMEVTTETVMSDIDKPVSESGTVTVSAAEPSDGSVLKPASQSDPGQAHVSTCQPEAPETEIKVTVTPDSVAEDETLPEAAPGAGDCASNSPAPQAAAAQGQDDEDSQAKDEDSQAKEEAVSGKTEEQQKVSDQKEEERGAPTVEMGKNEKSAAQTNTEEEESVKKLNTSGSLPPFNPSNPVGMEFLVPKTGFFCKVCNRFFSGGKEAEISHCKTLRHYENLQKYLQTKTMETAEPTRS